MVVEYTKIPHQCYHTIVTMSMFKEKSEVTHLGLLSIPQSGGERCLNVLVGSYMSVAISVFFHWARLIHSLFISMMMYFCIFVGVTVVYQVLL